MAINTDGGNLSTGGIFQPVVQTAPQPTQPANTYLPNGETPLAGPPTAGTTKNQAGQNWAPVSAFNQFVKTFGRNPTQQELDQLTPAYLGGDPNIGNTTGGNAAVASYYEQQANSPQNIYQQQQSQFVKQAPQFADQVTQAFQSSLGRAPTADEQAHFGALMASGQDAYQVAQALQQTQEYQNTQNTNFQNTLQGQLQDSNSTYFKQYILPGIQAQAAQSGRSLDSSGINSALSQSALQQNQQLQQYLAGVSSQNFQNSTANATNQYNNLMGQQYGLQNAGVSNSLSNQASNQQYNQQLNNFQLQQQAYNNYLSRYGGGGNNTLSGGISGAITGGAAGSKFGPWGALIGGVAGGGLGAFGGSKQKGNL